MSRLADMFGKRLMMILCMVAMTVGSVSRRSAGSFLTVIIGRALQGFAAALIPIGISIMRDELPKEKVGSAVALMSATLGIGGALGLPLSGTHLRALGLAGDLLVLRRRPAVLLIVRCAGARFRVDGPDQGAVRLSSARRCCPSR